VHPPPAGRGIADTPAAADSRPRRHPHQPYAPQPPPHQTHGASYLVIVGGLAVAAALVAPRGLRGFAADRFGWVLLPVGYRVPLRAAKSRG